MQGNGPDEEHEDPNGECAAEIARLEAANEELVRGMAEMAERFTAVMAPHIAGPEISLEHVQRLSRVFNAGANLRSRNDEQINEWLKFQISRRA